MTLAIADVAALAPSAEASGFPSARRPREAHSRSRTGRLVALIRFWRLRLRERQELRELALAPDSVLEDVGISRAEARWRADAPFWRP